MRKVFGLLVILAIATAPVSVVAQGGIGIAGHVGTLGIGADAAISPAPGIGLRAGANIMPLEPSATYSGEEFTVELQSPQFTAMIDLYPAGGFRLSGGLRYSSSSIVLSGDITESVDLGGTDYSLESLVGTIVTPDISPYVGIGFGNPTKRGIGFFFDAGVAYQGEPELDLVATGNAATLPGFNEDLEAERLEIEEELGNYFKFYPVISLGISIGF